ncbi:phosphoribosyl-ATP diphosphatase [Curvivirga sp.]|uniref:phosphoribosyl-ATP diphosphatase n=1 Tax=Curvivirga sp. TaxID=2856848 RepID=UPI003B5CAE66
MSEINALVLDELFKVIESRKGDDPSTSYTAKLFTKGIEKIAQKVGEEATEVVIESITGNQKALTSESADLLYHLMVLWADQGVKPNDVFAELAKRQGISGIDEKASRPKD